MYYCQAGIELNFLHQTISS